MSKQLEGTATRKQEEELTAPEDNSLDLDTTLNSVSVLVEWLFIYNLQQCSLPYDTTHHVNVLLALSEKASIDKVAQKLSFVFFSVPSCFRVHLVLNAIQYK